MAVRYALSKGMAPMVTVGIGYGGGVSPGGTSIDIFLYIYSVESEDPNCME